MTCNCSSLSPFRWAERTEPSIFGRDSTFFRGAATGKTMGMIQTEKVEQYEDRTGRSCGSLYGLSAKGDRAVTSRQDQHITGTSKYAQASFKRLQARRAKG